jgi:hypothetical protein
MWRKVIRNYTRGETGFAKHYKEEPREAQFICHY